MKETVTIRIDKELMDTLRKEAMKDNRTLNNYIETSLKKYFEELEKQKQKNPGE